MWFATCVHVYFSNVRDHGSKGLLFWKKRDDFLRGKSKLAFQVHLQKSIRNSEHIHWCTLVEVPVWQCSLSEVAIIGNERVTLVERNKWVNFFFMWLLKHNIRNIFSQTRISEHINILKENAKKFFLCALRGNSVTYFFYIF